MNFSKESVQFTIRNLALIEGGIVEDIQGAVFKAINARLEKKIKALGGWKGKFELITGGTDAETIFAPVTWPESQDGRWRACYKLSALSEDENVYWLASALGVNDCRLCLRFWVHGGLGGRSKGDVERRLTVAAHAVKDSGIIQDQEDKTLYLPFLFDTETLAAEYPVVDKSLTPLDAALDKLLQVHPEFDKAVKDLTTKR